MIIQSKKILVDIIRILINYKIYTYIYEIYKYDFFEIFDKNSEFFSRNRYIYNSEHSLKCIPDRNFGTF